MNNSSQIAGVQFKFAFKDRDAARRVDALYEHLSKVHAKCGWSIDYTQDGTFSVRVEFWFTDKGQYMVRVFDDGGWDVFGQLDATNKIDACLEKIV